MVIQVKVMSNIAATATLHRSRYMTLKHAHSDEEAISEQMPLLILHNFHFPPHVVGSVSLKDYFCRFLKFQL